MRNIAFRRSRGFADLCVPVGPSSSIAFTSEVSIALARLSTSTTQSHQPSGLGTTREETLSSDYRIARIPRRKSVDTPVASVPPSTSAHPTNANARSIRPSSLFYLPPEEETSALVDSYFNDTALLFPYIHEDSFRGMYARLPRGNPKAMRRTWLGLLNMILAMATYVGASPHNSVEARHAGSEAFYRRATGLCEGHISRTANLEIGRWWYGHAI